MPVARSRRAGGFTLVELVAVVVVIAVLASILFRLMTDYAEKAEQTAMEQVALAVQAALNMRVAALIAQKEKEENILALQKQNPIDWLAEKPHIYAGAFYGVAPPELAQRRSWYYDTQVHELVYRPERTRYLIGTHNAEQEIRFKVSIEVGELPGNEKLKKPLRGIKLVQLAPIEPYEWRMGQQ